MRCLLLSTNKRKILLVDDEPDIVNVFKKGFEMQGYSIDTFTKPQEALDNYKSNQYDRICIDIRMPGMTGFELARAIWRQDADAKVCFLSAFEIYEYEANKVFADFKTMCFVKKPIAPTSLIGHIEKHLMNTAFSGPEC